METRLNWANASAEPHMGGAYSTIAADVIARYQRLQGKKVTFVTGTDEHGEKIALSAEKAGLTPREHCDRIAGMYHQLWMQVSLLHNLDNFKLMRCAKPSRCWCTVLLSNKLYIHRLLQSVCTLTSH